MKARHKLSYHIRAVRLHHRPEDIPWNKLGGLVEALGWRLEGERLIRAAAPPINAPAPGCFTVFDDTVPTVDAENRLFMALFKFVGGELVQLSSNLSLLEFEMTCWRLQESLGLPVDPFFLLERCLYEVEGPEGAFLVETPRGLDPARLIAHLGPGHRVGKEQLLLPEKSIPELHRGLWIYRLKRRSMVR
ncbi:hypothetical protein Mlute_01794 [Meiothermus luteus]|jgi:hypothetical protein|uniref:Uncharacterized protein n=1 Tax=Meiothermus luteus TaxID=2026184 RepID=A0A399EP38_9DEIN|nr:hypothetical protein [Meiothermus luteus]RIH84809.1 hypothetical protein Mlute_01794 [Meiothermus luteus]RMH53828.1 MAG: hypothetical protein D6684_11365 [Deinococcota bacterium]